MIENTRAAKDILDNSNQDMIVNFFFSGSREVRNGFDTRRQRLGFVGLNLLFSDDLYFTYLYYDFCQLRITLLICFALLLFSPAPSFSP